MNDRNGIYSWSGCWWSRRPRLPPAATTTRTDGGEETTAATEVEQFPADTTMAEIQEAGELNVGVKFDVPPFGLNNPQTGEVEGFDVDLATFIADKLGVEPNFREATSDNRIPLLVDGTIDLILSTMTITEERDLEVDFSEPYYVANGDVLVPPDSDIATPRRPERQAGLHGARLDLRGHDREGGPGRGPAARRPVLGVLRPDPDGRGRRGLDRQRDPHRDGDPGSHPAAARARLHDGAVRDRDPRRGHRDEAVRRRDATEYIDSGAWQAAYDEWVGQYIPEDQQQGPPEMTLRGGAEAVPAREVAEPPSPSEQEA